MNKESELNSSLFKRTPQGKLNESARTQIIKIQSGFLRVDKTHKTAATNIG